ncbi:hypothetical protein EON65_24580 [archaeon]|nr:MAG: hypothetical protein EON65_24580 [archaeon]
MAPKRPKVVARDVSLLDLASKKAQLVDSLKNFYEEWKELPQEVFLLSERNKQLFKELVANELMSHSDKEVRLLLGCCLTEVLRIYAPEAPYPLPDMIRVFQLLIAQIRGLETHDPKSSQGSMMLAILHSLAKVKSCVVPIMLLQQGVDEAQEVVTSLFEVMVNILRPDSTEEGELKNDVYVCCYGLCVLCLMVIMCICGCGCMMRNTCNISLALILHQ